MYENFVSSTSQQCPILPFFFAIGFTVDQHQRLGGLLFPSNMVDDLITLYGVQIISILVHGYVIDT